MTTLQADLHELRVAQEAYRNTDGHLEYATNIEELGDRFVAGEGVIIEIVTSGPDGWSAEAYHELASSPCAYSSDWGATDCSGAGLEGSDNQQGGRSDWQVQ